MKNIKVGIITINNDYNFGNRLQNYALIKYLSNMNIDAENIHKISSKQKIKKIIKKFIPKKDYIRSGKFNKFNKNIKTKYIKDYSFNKEQYNFFITGSDQVWNPNFAAKNEQFLDFAKNNQKISYAASIGLPELPKQEKERFKKYLEEFKSISVREDAGKKIVEDLTDRKDVEVLIDPTMLLSQEEWTKILKKPSIKIEKKYILIYFLGKMSEKRKQAIEKIAKEKNYQIINIFDKKSNYYKFGPAEFLYLEKNASLICTDSFHSCVFSILFNRPFVSFDREEQHMDNMNSRIDTLISKFKLENRRFNGKEITKENLNHDYTEAYKILEKERKKSAEFLKKALDIE